MRKLMALFAISILSVATPSWALVGLGDISFDGSLEISGNAANNEASFSAAEDHRGNTATRVRLGMNAQVTEGVTGRVELGRTPNSAGSSESLYGGTGKPTSLTQEQGNFVINNAFIKLDNFLGHDLKLGRQYVGDDGDLVWYVGPHNDDSLNIVSIDGLGITCNKGEPKGNFMDKLRVTLFAGKAVEDDGVANTNSGDTTGDVNMNNIQFDLDLNSAANLRLAYLDGRDANSSASNDDDKLRILRLGAKGMAAENRFTYHAEFLQNMGENKSAGLDGNGNPADLDYKGNAIDLGVGLSSPETDIGSFGFWLNYVMASGDDNVIDSEDKSFHDFSEFGGINTSGRHFGEIMGKSNTLGSGGSPLGQGVNTADATGIAPDGSTQGQGLNVLNIGLNFKPSFLKSTWARLDYFTFSRAEDEVKTAANTNTKVGDKFGNEIDLTIGYDHSDNVGLELGYAMLNVDDAITGVGAVNDDAVTKLFARGKVKWGGAEAN